MTPTDLAAVAAYRAFESAIMAKADRPTREAARVAFTQADATAQAARLADGRPRLNYLAALAAGAAS